MVLALCGNQIKKQRVTVAINIFVQKKQKRVRIVKENAW
jgi:hypothetical protein